MDTAASSFPEPVIRMDDVSAGSMRDADQVVVEHLDWTVASGDYWVIGGLQGSGKTDFLMMAGGVMPPRGGSYWLLGEEMPIFDPGRLKHRLRLGLVFDGGQLLHHLTIAENIALPLRYHRNLTMAQAEAEVQKVLEWLELVPWANTTPSALGRNWQKRAGLGRALMLKPEVLLLDDPLGGLDPRHVNWWLGQLAALSRGHELLDGRPMTLVITTADLRPWKNHARQFAILKDKRLEILGDWTRLESAGDQVVKELLNLPSAGGA